MAADIPDEIRARHLDRIAAFVLRARRVEAHSLLRDLRLFNRWAQGTTTIGPVDGVMCMTQDVPPEEAFESLASRCRPFLLTRDPIHWRAVFGSLRAFLKGDSRFGPAVESLRDSWAKAEAPDSEAGFAVTRPEEVASQAVWFATLADSWLYGDLVHADPAAREKAAGHTLSSRYSAAVLLYGQVAIHVVATLNLIRQARTAELLLVKEETFSEPVTAKVPMRFPMVGFVQADIGTPTQVMFDALDAVQAASTTATQAESAAEAEPPGTTTTDEAADD
ncbi:hypothetical protein [Phytoactinopolyspora mesophila]|uniref:Uncharacterized protein n=1 Tax=Phytoactinopolyspora mesophila TaxID=2650750 RepID=A0A7K3LXY4_9ACTN|nr:hypothetical protein [Phytoactinopolyspora mesophila]NDL55883.1 hypothetical protein [Phytoactinopolyspora mesophila]